MTAQAATDPYPAADETHYGHHVWPLGEDGDEGAIVSGHGRRALAALNAYRRGQDPCWNILEAADPEEKWVQFHETCGHTDEQHAEHDAAFRDDGDFECDCKWWGLPPCEPERFAWRIESVPETERGALPVLEVRW